MFEDKLAVDNDDNCSANNQSDNEDLFGDTQTIGVHAKFVSKLSDEKIPIFGDRDGEQQSSFGRSVRDQFAIALLRLQKDLDGMNNKLKEVEMKANSISRQILNYQQISNKQIKGKRIGLFNKGNMYSSAGGCFYRNVRH